MSLRRNAPGLNMDLVQYLLVCDGMKTAPLWLAIQQMLKTGNRRSKALERIHMSVHVSLCVCLCECVCLWICEGVCVCLCVFTGE